MARRDSFPERAKYTDDGCRYHPACLTCPFTVCVMHELRPSRIRAYFNAPRDERIRELKAAGVPVPVITREFGVTERTVFKIVADGALRASRKAVIPA